MTIGYLPRIANNFAYHLAKQACYHPELTLFHRGMELPRWVIDAAEEAGLAFYWCLLSSLF